MKIPRTYIAIRYALRRRTVQLMSGRCHRAQFVDGLGFVFTPNHLHARALVAVIVLENRLKGMSRFARFWGRLTEFTVMNMRHLNAR